MRLTSLHTLSPEGIAGPNSEMRRWDHDGAGKILREETVDALGNVRTLREQAYDINGRLWKEFNPDYEDRSVYREWFYDGNGNNILVIDEKGRRKEMVYDGLNRLIEIRQELEGEEWANTQYRYDTYGNLTHIVDANENETQYEYDDMGKLLRSESPDAGVIEYRHDVSGNLIWKKDSRGIEVRYFYDGINRLLGVSYPDPSENVTYIYDEGLYGGGKLTSVEDPSGRTGFSYNASGRITSERTEILGHRFETRYSYDINGNLREIVYPSGNVVRYHGWDDNRNRVKSMVWAENMEQQEIAREISWEPFGGIRKLIYGNGIETNIERNLRGQIRNINSEPALKWDLEIDEVGNITRIEDLIEPQKSQELGYNFRNMLTYAHSDGTYGEMWWSYDHAGNRLTETRDGLTDNYRYYSQTNRLMEVADGDLTGFSYDASGNTITYGDKTLEYNQAGRLSQVLKEGEKLGRYVSNPHGSHL